jgi:glycosyltransferase involved in cell wall biosynthesis
MNTNMCRILITGPRPWKRGGIPRVIGNVAPREASCPELQLWMYCSSPNKLDLRRRSYQGVPVKVFSRQGHFPYSPYGMYRELVKTKDDFDVVHIHGVASIETLIVALATYGKPIVVNPYYHLEASKRWLEFFKKPYDWIVIWWLLHRADRIICISKIEAYTLRQKFGRELAGKTVLIPIGVDSQTIQQASPHTGDSCLLLLYAGRLERFKNIHLIVDAMPYLPRDFKLCIIGQGSYREHISEQIRNLQLENRVHLMGAVSDQELYRWLRTCSAFVTLSSYESFGITVLEALAAGKPVVVNDKWGLYELARAFPEAILPVRAESISPAALARHMEQACSMEVNVNLEAYDWDRIAQSIASVHLDVCRGNRTP